ncbi:hypothetical protein GC096_00650 [Paenibacillus sp. LMG 31461]|uniref:SLH domain-containing protein n=1 Tax=Paenibacillus plantarum TaxID=2654975 RepID=A0ABX1X369_9BACL|nr:S-layer homology domain-containing protein [Paenibacillus plantarum]NOU62554.1 hypothetical protein [Paenibacillus plantarum]
MRNVRTILLSLICLFVAASAMDTHKAHALSSSTIVATTDQTSYYVGDTVKVIIKGENILDLSGVGFTLNYDPSQLSLQGDGLVLSSSYETFGGAIVDTINGRLTYDILNKAPVQITKTEAIGQIHFKALKSGIGMIQLRGITAVNGNLVQVQSSTQMQTAFSIGTRLPVNAPVTTATLTPDTPNGENGWYKTDVSVSLTVSASEAGGVVTTEYQVNDGAWNTYTGSIPAFGDGTYKLGYRSKDQAGNEEALKTVEFKVDKKAPTQSSSSNPTSTIPTTTTPKPTTTQIVKQNDLPAAVKGRIAVQMEEGKDTVLLPSHLTDLIGDNSLQFVQKDFTIEFSKEALKNMQGALAGKQAEGAQLSFSATIVSHDEVTNLVHDAINGSTRVVTASQVYDFNLHVVTTDGTRIPITTFKEPLVLSFKVNPNADPHLLGVYYIAPNGTIQYVGGTLVNGMMTVKVTHFSQYAVLEYNRTFSDVASSLWASGVIKKMAAKHIIEGVTDTEFNPEGHVTRAQFAALLARALDLKAVGSAHYKDVNPGDWHAQVIAAVSESGIVFGRSSDTFAPDDAITREEMAVMAVRAYEHVKGEQVKLTNTSSFSDQDQIHEWAQNAVRAAQEISLIQGRSSNQFAPQALMTRAESAQVISNLLND